MKITAIISGILLIALDQLTKIWAYSSLRGEPSIVLINNFFQLTYLENRGAAFGILYGHTWFLILVSVFLIAFIVFYYRKIPNGMPHTLLKTSLVLIASGGIGNFIDRIFRGFVIDFFDARIFGYNFPVFNVADILIVVGAIGFAFLTLIIKEEK